MIMATRCRLLRTNQPQKKLLIIMAVIGLMLFNLFSSDQLSRPAYIFILLLNTSCVCNAIRLLMGKTLFLTCRRHFHTEEYA